ncbi:MAG: ankyrin repeat domain-containing protein [Gemmatimonadaceae bacterium]|jgi:hypothetical protein
MSGPDIEYVRKMHKFKVLCEKGDLSEVQAAFAAHNLGPADVRHDQCAALRAACIGAQLPVMYWLWDTFKLNSDDARSYGNMALIYACREGDLDVVKWLREVAGLTTKDARTAERVDCSAALRLASCYGHESVVDYLITGFGLTAADMRMHKYYALWVASKNKNCGVVDLILRKFPELAQEWEAFKC